MKGILKYTTAGWFVWYTRKKDEITSGYDSIPLHPSEKVDDSFRDKEVEFKIIYYLETGIEEPFKVAELVKAYPYLKGTMNLCEDIIEKRTGKMTEEEWQAAENKLKPKYTPGKGISFYIEKLDSKLPKQENCCTPIGQIKRYVDCIGCDRKPNQETIEEVTLKYLKSKGVKMYPEEVHLFTAGAKWQEKRMYSEEEVINFLQEMNDWPTTFEGRIDIREWFEQFKKK
jgi:hypothetical protein